MKLHYKTCPLCENGSIAYYEDEPQLDPLQLAILEKLPDVLTILSETATSRGLTVAEMTRKGRKPQAVEGRKEAMKKLQDLGLGPSLIGAILRRHHSTVITTLGDDYQTRYSARQ